MGSGSASLSAELRARRAPRATLSVAGDKIASQEARRAPDPIYHFSVRGRRLRPAFHPGLRRVLRDRIANDRVGDEAVRAVRKGRSSTSCA